MLLLLKLLLVFFICRFLKIKIKNGRNQFLEPVGTGATAENRGKKLRVKGKKKKIFFFFFEKKIIKFYFIFLGYS